MEWNPSTNKLPPHKILKNHICMFGENLPSDAKRLQDFKKSNALFFRFKQYSSSYYHHLIETVTNSEGEDVIPYGCIQFYANHFHIHQNQHGIPLLQCCLQHLYPISMNTHSEPV